MRITMVGSGGVGGYFGARLAQGGCDVGFVARGAHLAAMREHGLRVESQLGEIHLPRLRVSDDPAALGPADYAGPADFRADVADSANHLFSPDNPAKQIVLLDAVLK